MSAQTIVTPRGERLIVLPEADYRALVEAAEDAADLADLKIFDHRLAAGEEELVPSEVADRILNGENRVRVWRDHRGMSPAHLAEGARITLDELSEIESDRADGSVATLRKIATAMNLSIDDLVA